MVCHETYRDARRQLAAARGGDKRRRRRLVVRPSTARPVERRPLEKMSKSKKNVVDPDADHRRPTAPTPRAGSCCPTARPSATSNGPRPASRAPGASSSGCGAWSTTALAALPPAGTADARRSSPTAAIALRRADPQDHRRRHRRHRALPLQQGGGAAPRARQRASTTLERRGAGDRLGAARGARDLRPPDRADDAASRRGAVAGARATRRCWPTRPGRWPTPTLLRRRHGDDRGAGQRQAARHDRAAARQRKRARPSRRRWRDAVQRAMAGKAARKVIVVPNRIVNVVV